MTPKFRAGLYEGTSTYYDRFRRPYPQELFDDLYTRLPVSGEGRLLDLACGTGQIALPMRDVFREVVAIDAEFEAIAFAAEKASRLDPPRVRWIVGTAESPPVRGSFELIAIGTAFHRLDRPRVARRARELVSDRGALALLWSPVPSDGDQPWQRELAQIIADWVDHSTGSGRLPAGWQEALVALPDRQVLENAGFRYSGRFEFEREDTWTVESLIGFMYSTSILSRDALGGSTDEFEADVQRRLRPFLTQGTFDQRTHCVYEFARPL